MKTLLMSIFALSIATGGAFAASTGGSGSSALDNPEMMSPFFTDTGMKTMRSDNEFKAAWIKMSSEDQAEILKECKDPTLSKAHDPFCKTASSLGGSK